MKVVFEAIYGFFSTLFYCIKNFKEDIVYSIGFICAACCGLVSFIFGIIYTVEFGRAGGYADKLEDGLIGATEKITTGNLKKLYEGVLLKIIVILLAIVAVTLVVSYICNAKLIRNIFLE